MSSFRPIDDWPLILCGPMLRRVTRDEVCVFVALRDPARVTLQLFDAAGTLLADRSPHPHPTLPIGRQLHVTVAVHRPLLGTDQIMAFPLYTFRCRRSG